MKRRARREGDHQNPLKLRKRRKADAEFAATSDAIARRGDTTTMTLDQRPDQWQTEPESTVPQ